MSTVRYIDVGIQCNVDDCLTVCYASQADVDGMPALICYLRRKGWQVSRARKDAWDLCPACAKPPADDDELSPEEEAALRPVDVGDDDDNPCAAWQRSGSCGIDCPCITRKDPP